MHNVLQKIKQRNIPQSLYIEVELKAIKFAADSKSTLIKVATTIQGWSHHHSELENNNKLLIIATFVITFSGEFLAI